LKASFARPDFTFLRLRRGGHKMLRTCYLWLVRLHPAPFRQQFEEEMLAIFDDVAACKSVRGLFVDAAASLFRQWVLRPEFRRAPPDKAVPVASGQVPVFASLDSYRIRPGPLVSGCLLSVAVLWAVATASVRPGKLPSWLIGAHTATGDLLPIQRSSLTETEPNTLVRFGPEPGKSMASRGRRLFQADSRARRARRER